MRIIIIVIASTLILCASNQERSHTKPIDLQAAYMQAIEVVKMDTVGMKEVLLRNHFSINPTIDTNNFQICIKKTISNEFEELDLRLGTLMFDTIPYQDLKGKNRTRVRMLLSSEYKKRANSFGVVDSIATVLDSSDCEFHLTIFNIDNRVLVATLYVPRDIPFGGFDINYYFIVDNGRAILKTTRATTYN